LVSVCYEKRQDSHEVLNTLVTILLVLLNYKVHPWSAGGVN